MHVVILKFTLRNQGSFHWAKLCTFGDAFLGKHSSHKVINVEDQRQAGPCLGHHWSVGYWVEGSMFKTD